MELWVRSQSKQTLIKAEKIFTEDEEVYATTNSEFNERIGVYKSKERALEVLDEIEERICLLNIMSLVNDTNLLISLKKVIGEDKIKGLSYPYQMPKD